MELQAGQGALQNACAKGWDAAHRAAQVVPGRPPPSCLLCGPSPVVALGLFYLLNSFCVFYLYNSRQVDGVFSIHLENK